MHSADDLPSGTAVGSNREVGVAPARSVAAGFGSPADDSTVRRIDLNEQFIRHPEATFVVRAAGDGMRDVGIEDGDVLLVDRAVAPAHNHVVVAIVDGDLVCRRLCRQDGRVLLQAAHPDFQDIVIREESPLEVWGVVTTVIKQLQL